MSQNEVVTTESKQMDLFHQPPVEAMLSGDMLIPRLLLMQGLSEFITERKKSSKGQALAQGDMVRSTNLDLLGGPDGGVDIIPLKMVNEWRLEESVGGKFEYRMREPRTAANDGSPWEFEKNGAKWKRTKVINLYCLLVQDVLKFSEEIKKAAETGEMPDMDTALLPVVVSFRSMSYNAGKGVATFFAKVEDMKRYSAQAVPYGYSLSLTCKQTKNEKGSFYVFEVGKSSKQPEAVTKEAARWYEILRGPVALRVDETGEDATHADQSDNTDPQVC